VEVSDQIHVSAALVLGKIPIPTEKKEEEKENHMKTGETPTTDMLHLRRIV
jgi:hypothetical protein